MHISGVSNIFPCCSLPFTCRWRVRKTKVNSPFQITLKCTKNGWKNLTTMKLLYQLSLENSVSKVLGKYLSLSCFLRLFGLDFSLGRYQGLNQRPFQITCLSTELQPLLKCTSWARKAVTEPDLRVRLHELFWHNLLLRICWRIIAVCTFVSGQMSHPCWSFCIFASSSLMSTAFGLNS